MSADDLLDALDPDQRAAKVVSQMTQDEKIATVFAYFATEFKGIAPPKEGRPYSAGQMRELAARHRLTVLRVESALFMIPSASRWLMVG